MSDKQKEPWYHKGLPFKCTGCGQCCTGAPGYVWLTMSEAQTIATHLNLPLPTFLATYTHRIGGRLSLREHPKTYDCVFLKGKQCQIYPHRPRQCRTFPWWKENLTTPEAWAETAARCEGINHPEAPLITLGEITENL